jgi:hypothetical protein
MCSVVITDTFPVEWLCEPCSRHEETRKLKAIDWVLKNAELLGSRGWARMNGRPEPEDADHDYCFFTDDPERLWEYRNLLMRVVREESGWVAEELDGGYLLIRGKLIDISVNPTIKRRELILAYRLRDAGITKQQMCLLLDELIELRKKGI